MAVSSMTGFSRAQGRNDVSSWVWEVKSVNGRGLDIRCRMPGGLDHLDQPVRRRAQAIFKRGSITLNLNIERTGKEVAYRVNQAVLDEVIGLLPEIQARIPGASAPSLDGIFALRGVIETADDSIDEDDQAAFDVEILESLDAALQSLLAARQSEGERLAGILSSQLDEVAELCVEAEALTAMQPQTIRERLNRQISALIEDTPTVSEERLAQEAAVLMTKADPREELDRLKAHLEAARGLMGEDKPIGRRFDFLCQEFNREANTLCSKAADLELSRRGLALKAVIDQLREQVQNVE
ncbi:MAG: YicC family protein [Rhodospirillales bacterium]|nr:YicC family protein [Rhodospirillales bacterium]